jgi:DNA-directed RNA polymerase subunit beta'
VDVWTQATDTIANALYRKIEFNEGKEKASPLFMMVDSGARGNKSQIKQLGGMRGLMAKPSGEIIERPIISNFREGLSVLEYFISTHGARKGLSDTALKTADSGYMTRKLVDVAQDVIITQQDCGTANGISVAAILTATRNPPRSPPASTAAFPASKSRIPSPARILVEVDDVINEKQAKAVERIGVLKLKIRSVLTCESDRGCCANCYGLNLATGLPVKIGEAVGIIAAQSIGEPGTQLTMRTFHVGGVAAATFKQPIIKAKNTGRLVYKDLRTVQAADGTWVVLNKNGTISIRDKAGLELESHNIVIGSIISVKDGEDVKKGDTVVTWDPYNVPILTEKGGKVEFRDMISGITVTNETDKETGKKGMVVTEHKEDLHPQVVIIDEKTKEVKASYSIPVGAHLSVKEGQVVTGGTSSPRPRAKSPAPRTSPAVCRAWPSFSKPASPRTPASSPRSRARFPSAPTSAARSASSSPTPRPASRSTTSCRWASTSSSPMATR